MQTLEIKKQQVQVIQLQVSNPRSDFKSRLKKLLLNASRWMSWESMSRQK